MIDPLDAFRTLHPVAQAFVATCGTWLLTALGASTVLLVRGVRRSVLDALLGFSGGVMIAASFWSLLVPSVELTEGTGLPAWLPAVVGLVLGAATLQGVDRVLPHLHLGFSPAEAEGLRTTWRRTVLLILAITLHNIPEGLAVGVLFGAAALATDTASLSAALTLAVGIGLQNVPEGLAVAAPLRREGVSRWRSFWYGQSSAMVEPLAGAVGAAAVLVAQPILPYALGFAAGAMIFVVIEEVIPEAQRGGNADLATLGAVAGLVVMTILDVQFG
ncbi:MAG TPA: ZIP family metal transporter [Chloroflexota bacterium]